MVNGRITAEQMEWLQKRADSLGGNMSAALRQTITDGRLLEMARADYKDIQASNPDFRIPRHEDDGTTRVTELALSGFEVTESADADLRRAEAQVLGRDS